MLHAVRETDSDVVLHGVMMKRGRGRHSSYRPWKERLFLLYGSQKKLVYFSVPTFDLDWSQYRPPSALKRGEISIADCCVSKEPEVDKLRPYMFRVTSGNDRLTISCPSAEIRDRELNHEYLMEGMPPRHPQHRHSHRSGDTRSSETRSSATSFESRRTGLTSNDSHSSNSSGSVDLRHMSGQSAVSDLMEHSLHSVPSMSSEDTLLSPRETFRRPRSSTYSDSPHTHYLRNMPQACSENNLRQTLFSRLSRSNTVLSVASLCDVGGSECESDTGFCDPSLLALDVTSLDENDDLVATPLYLEDIHLEQQQEDLLDAIHEENPMLESQLHRCARRYSFDEVPEIMSSTASTLEEQPDSAREAHVPGVSKHLERYRSMANYKAHMLKRDT